MKTTDLPDTQTHSLTEDLVAMIIGAFLVSFGAAIFSHEGLLTGGTAGLAFLVHYLTGYSFGAMFFVINLPFYYFAYKRMGWRFTLKTFCAVGLVSLFSIVHVRFATFSSLSPFYTATIGGFVMGVGCLVLFRHRASLGGVNILALYLQNKYGMRAGKIQLFVDAAIVLGSIFVVSPVALAASIVGATIMNLIIAMNHRPGRYAVTF